MKEKILYPGFLHKAVTFSFDDGTYCDVFATELLNRYKLKGAFNLNSGLFGQEATLHLHGKDIYHNHIAEAQVSSLYRGHEVASHAVHHPLLPGQPKEFLDDEVLGDIAALTRITGEQTVGFAYPGGPHDDVTDAYLRGKVLYARSAADSQSFALPTEFVPFDPTICIFSPDFERVCAEYLAKDSEQIDWLYIWGHSYEFCYDGIYAALERVCKALTRRDDIWKATGRDIIRYVTDARRLTADGDRLINDTDSDLYIEVHEKQIIIPAHATVKLA